MKFKKYIVLLFAVPGIFSSCTKGFLDVNNTSQLFRESYVKDLTAMKEYMGGTYLRIGGKIDGGAYAQTNNSYAEIAADNIKPFSTTTVTAAGPLYNWTMVPTLNENLGQFWKECYFTIRMCNFVIDNSAKYREENPSLADDIKGQAYGIRALIHFKLVNCFAQHYTFTADASHPGVPYITSPDITQPYSRNSVKEVYEGMISDLTNAIQLLPAIITDARNMNRNAAKALLARVYLFKEDYSNAKTAAEEIINEVPLMTIAAGYPDDMFKFKPAGTTEVLFQIIPNSNSLGRYVGFAPVTFSATKDVADILQENSSDVRRNWIKDTIAGGSTSKLVKKFPIGVAPEFVTSNPNASYYPPCLRSSEMFLTAAEAAAKTGDETTALRYLNDIRKRANPTIADVNAGGAALLDSIYKERRKELSFEGLRHFDLQRWKKGVNRIDVLTGSPAQLPYPSDKAIAPLPADEVRLSGIPQNIGY